MTTVLLEITAHIAYITLNNPYKNNILSPDIITTLEKILLDIQHNKTISWIVLRANGKNFCAGADLNWLQTNENLDIFAKLLTTIYQLSKPIIAYVQGAALAGALGILAICDVVIAAENSYFGLSEVKLGLIPAMIAPYLIEAIGFRQTKRLALSAQYINAHEAHIIGLVHGILTEQEFILYVNNLKKAAPQALQICKNMCHELKKTVINDNLIAATVTMIKTQRQTPEATLGIKSFLQRTTINWYANGEHDV